jgi:predicted ATPase
MAKIEGIRIQNFRGLKDVSMGIPSKNIEAEFLTPMTVVIGKNGVGKSTLFDAFGFLADALKFGVEEACDLRGRGGFEKIRSQGQNKPIAFTIVYRGHNTQSFLIYAVDIDIDENKRPFVKSESLSNATVDALYFISISGTALTIKDNEIARQGFERTDFSIFLNRHNNIEDWIKERSLEDKVEVVKLSDNRKLAIATFGALKKHPEISEFRQFMESWYLSYFTPDAARTLPLSGAQQHLNSKGDNLANVVQYMEREHRDVFQDILNRIAEKIPGIHKIDTEKTSDGRLLLRFNDKGFQDPFYAPQMSDGTLKVFAYLLLLEAPNPPPFICIEEPENGLYHKLLEVLAAEFRAHTQRENGSQLFITTHQPYFVNGLNPREVWILEKGEDGFSTIRRASDDDLVNNLVEEEMPLGGLWYSGYLDKRAKPCTLKS